MPSPLRGRPAAVQIRSWRFCRTPDQLIKRKPRPREQRSKLKNRKSFFCVTFRSTRARTYPELTLFLVSRLIAKIRPSMRGEPTPATIRPRPNSARIRTQTEPFGKGGPGRKSSGVDASAAAGTGMGAAMGRRGFRRRVRMSRTLGGCGLTRGPDRTGRQGSPPENVDSDGGPSSGESYQK